MPEEEPLYNGKAKTIFASHDPNYVIQYFKDDATAFNAQKHAIIEGKGQLNNLISEYIMLKLGAAGIETHFIKRLDARRQLVKKVDIIPIEVVVRNIAAGSMVKRLSGQHIKLQDGMPLSEPMIEYYLKEDRLNDPIISPVHIIEFNLASKTELDFINSQTLRINQELQKIFTPIGITLIDFKIEFGRLNNSIILADEISPDNCRLWDSKTGEKKDKDVFRHDLGNLNQAYNDIAQRLNITKG